jgi:hypothetical protein
MTIAKSFGENLSLIIQMKTLYEKFIVIDIKTKNIFLNYLIS